jgi:hypothetical protein
MGRLVAGLMLAAACAAGASGCGMIEDMQYVRAEREAHEQPRVSGLAIPTVPPPSSANPALLEAPAGPP